MGMLFIPWRMRWETVWAVVSSIEVLSSRSSANWLTAVLLLLQTPLAFALHLWGEPGAYRDGAAHLQCLTHEELGARAHRHTGRLAHHHHGQIYFGDSTVDIISRHHSETTLLVTLTATFISVLTTM